MRGHSHLEMPLVRPRVGCSFSVLVTQSSSPRLSFILFIWSWEACSFVFKYASVYVCICVLWKPDENLRGHSSGAIDLTF